MEPRKSTTTINVEEAFPGETTFGELCGRGNERGYAVLTGSLYAGTYVRYTPYGVFSLVGNGEWITGLDKCTIRCRVLAPGTVITITV